jgi:hypothetical protein
MTSTLASEDDLTDEIEIRRVDEHDPIFLI